MQTKEALSRGKQRKDSPRAPVALAIEIFRKVMSKLPSNDRRDFVELMKEFGKAKTEEDFEAIRLAMVELLDQSPLDVEPMPRLNGKRPEKLQKWVDYVGKTIRDLRRARNITQEELAERSGLPQSHISRIESGQHSPSHHTISKIAKGLRVPIGQLDPTVE
jgi:ribosome-binding protein aMBF1 (putative translation factor)